MRCRKSRLSTKSAISRSRRFATLSERTRLSTAMMSRSPRSLSARTRLEPMKPAAPVTMSAMVSVSRGEALGELRGVDDSGSELAHDDSRRMVGDAHRIVQARARGDHEREHGDDGVARAAHVVDLARARVLVVALRRREERHALLAARHHQRLEPELGAQALRAPLEVGVVLPASRHLAELAAVGRE